MAEQKLRPAMQPSVELEEGGPGKDAVVKVEVETLPEVPEAKIEGLKIERLMVEATEAMIDEALERLASRPEELRAGAGGPQGREGRPRRHRF